MSKRVRTLIIGSAVTLALALAPMWTLAQQRADQAPVPAAIAAAKRIFISNAGGGCSPFGESAFSGDSNRPYDQFYAAVKSWGRYELAAAPADADLDFELRFSCPAAGENVVKGGSLGPMYDPQFRLLILDVRTRLVLWGITQHVQPAMLEGNRDKNFDRAMTALMSSLKLLVAGPSAPPGGGSRGPANPR